MNHRMLLGLLLLIGCRSAEPASGTSVGNPGKLNPSVGDGEGVFIREAWGEVAAIRMMGCGGTVSEVAVNDDISLDGSEAIEIPAGSYCSVQLVMAGNLEIRAAWAPEDWDADDWDDEAVDEEGLDFTMSVPIKDLTQVNADASFEVDGDTLVLELGEPGWLYAGDIEVEDDEEHFDDESPESLEAAESLWKSSALWHDDGDGEVSDDERDEGPVATADQDAPSKAKKSSEESGCTTSAQPPGPLWALCVLVTVGRRRRGFNSAQD